MMRQVNTRDDMPLFQSLVLEDGCTLNKDRKHLVKRLARLIMWGTLTIGGHKLSLDMLMQLAEALGLPRVAAKLQRAWKEKDHTSVPTALDVLDALTEITMADHERLDPSRHAQASIVRRLHWFLKHTEEYYYQNGRTVHERLVSAAVASMHLMELYR